VLLPSSNQLNPLHFFRHAPPSESSLVEYKNTAPTVMLLVTDLMAAAYSLACVPPVARTALRVMLKLIGFV
jgi:hypothetical protein